MKTNQTATKGLYTGAGAGVVLFALIGLLHGSFWGGVIGLDMAGKIFGTPVGQGLLPRVMVGVSMVMGMLVSGVVFIAGTAVLGWIAGNVVGAIKYKRADYGTVTR